MDQKRLRVRRPILRIIVIWVIEALALVLATFLFTGMVVDDFSTALVAAAAIGLLNALLWPMLSYLILPFAVLTLGLAALILNGAIILLASYLVEGFNVNGLWAAIGVAFWLTAVNTIASMLLTIDDDSSWYRNVVRRRANRIAKPEKTDVPGFLFLEIDGLAEPILEKAMRDGYAPTLKQWLDEGSHKLVEWETDLSSQTSASQAGILHGNNDNIPAFRWYDRQRKTVVASSSPKEVAALEKRHSDGNGLLVDNGASRGNLLSGDAPIVSVTASTMKDLSRLHLTDFYAYFVDPYNITRTLLLMVWDIMLEIRQFRQARKNNVYPILDKRHRGGKYPLLRVFTTVIMRELNIYTLIGDMYAGVPSAYATFVGYDEVAHHSGVESFDALDTLRKLDAQFARLESAARNAPRPYHMVVLSDHGQSGGATFKQRYGINLQELVQQYATAFHVQGIMETNESWGHVNVLVNDAIQNDKRTAKALKRVTKRQTEDGEVKLGPDEHDEGLETDAHVLVLASGNLGLIYGTWLEERVTLEQIEMVYPGLLHGLASHEGVGWLMVHSEAQGPVVIGDNGRYYLADDRVEGENPLAGFGQNARDHLLRYNQFPDVPDIYVNSFYNAETNEVAAFEELIGCHGGMGGYQTRPFLLYPAELDITEPDLVGAPAVYRQLKTWLRQTHAAPTA
ncbi:MAG: phage holin family protein [Chloroflexi bacterium]|nr:phage holin family protein [Chloroflexota bacterium]MBP7042723.1 phage holin family protein [Chloroflexota bacterium]